jgi:hypothetical protein
MSGQSLTVLIGWCKLSSPYLLPVELIYRQLAQPTPPREIPANVEPGKHELNRDDVNAIIQRKRTATAEELQEIIGRGKELKLTEGEREQLAVDLTIFISQRTLQANGKRENPSSKLIHDLGYTFTPCGLLADRAWFQNELQAGTKAIAACRRHLPPECACWKEAREKLYGVRQAFNERSPESWVALRVWEALEEIEMSSRPERGPSRDCNSQCV